MTLDEIKRKAEILCKANETVYISGSITSPRMTFDKEPSKIKSVHKNIFRIEENSTGSPKIHTFQYTDIITKQIIIDKIEFE